MILPESSIQPSDVLHLLQEVADASFRKMEPETAAVCCLQRLQSLLHIPGTALVRFEPDDPLSGWILPPSDLPEESGAQWARELESLFREHCPHPLPAEGLKLETLSPCTADSPPGDPARWLPYPLQAEEEFLGLLALRMPVTMDAPRGLDPVLHQLSTGFHADRTLRKLLTTDPLTGAYNRWFMDVELEKACAGLSGYGPFALMVVDVDHFKSINDRRGHAAGDQVLIQLVERFRNYLQEGDAVIRMGGDEFLLWFPQVEERNLQETGARILEDVRSTFGPPGNAGNTVTVSIGLAVCSPDREDLDKEAALERADQALYRSKRSGRNCITVWGPDPDSASGDGDPASPSSGEEVEEQIVDLLSHILNTKEYETGLHSLRVTRITEYLLRFLEIPAEEKSAILRGARLHDIGKIAIPDAILHKTSSLNDSEWTVMRQHPRLGYRFIEPFPFLRTAAEVVLHHHERFDGTGYPQGLKGEQIPRGARLFSLVDSYDGMRSNRVYKTSTPKAEVVAEMKRQSGKQFDPDLLQLFLQHVEEIEEIGKWE